MYHGLILYYLMPRAMRKKPNDVGTCCKLEWLSTFLTSVAWDAFISALAVIGRVV